MYSLLDQLTQIVRTKLLRLGYTTPNATVLASLLNIAYLATLRTEEGRYVRGSLTFADPRCPDLDPPLCRRADYPAFTPFGRFIPLSVENLVKLARAIDSWCGSIAVYGTERSSIKAWGVLDQMVHVNLRIIQEQQGGFTDPGIVTIVMDGVGALSVYHRDLFLCGLQQDILVTRKMDALNSLAVASLIKPILRSIAKRIFKVVGGSLTLPDVERDLFEKWTTTIARICIGLRRARTGGALLITPIPQSRFLDILHPLSYCRLGHACILSVLDTAYLNKIQNSVMESYDKRSVPVRLAMEEQFAGADAEDRERELTGAVKIVTSLPSLMD